MRPSLQHKFPVFFLLGAIVLFLGIVFFLLSYTPPLKRREKIIAIPTAFLITTAIPSHPTELITFKRYVNEKANISLTYPSDWNKLSSTNPDDPVAIFIFTQQDKAYRFTISPPGQINPDGITEKVDIVQNEIKYGRTAFIKSIWSSQGVPFYITAVPKAIDPNSHTFSMQVPPQNSDMYMKFFDQTMDSLK